MEDQPEGIVLIDKPLTWTSFDVVKKLRNLSRVKKIGHAGTLDPLATGLLILCFGKFTKKIERIQNQPKEYTGCITVGGTTASYDLETEVDTQYPTHHITPELVNETLKQFTGVITQTPPAHSAVKIKGKRAYEYARAGKEVKIKSRQVTIDNFEITKLELPKIYFKINCSKGTYIRSLANDFGKALKSGGHLSELRRTKIGNFSVDKAVEPSIIKTKEEFFANSFKEI